MRRRIGAIFKNAWVPGSREAFIKHYVPIFFGRVKPKDERFQYFLNRATRISPKTRNGYCKTEEVLQWIVSRSAFSNTRIVIGAPEGIPSGAIHVIDFPALKIEAAVRSGLKQVGGGSGELERSHPTPWRAIEQTTERMATLISMARGESANFEMNPFDWLPVLIKLADSEDPYRSDSGRRMLHVMCQAMSAQRFKRSRVPNAHELKREYNEQKKWFREQFPDGHRNSVTLARAYEQANPPSEHISAAVVVRVKKKLEDAAPETGRAVAQIILSEKYAVSVSYINERLKEFTQWNKISARWRELMPLILKKPLA